MNTNIRWPIFWAMVVVFILIGCVFSIPALRELLLGFVFIIVSGAVFLLLGVALIVFTIRERVKGLPKAFFLLTGASAVGFLVSVLLHNVLSGLLIEWLGEGFLKGVLMGEEPFFFILAVIVCPLGFAVGVVGSMFLAIRGSQEELHS